MNLSFYLTWTFQAVLPNIDSKKLELKKIFISVPLNLCKCKDILYISYFFSPQTRLKSPKWESFSYFHNSLLHCTSMTLYVTDTEVSSLGFYFIFTNGLCWY